MSDPVIKIDVAGWVAKAKADPVAYLQRQASEITLNAIAMTAELSDKLYLKGGVLMGLAYGSPRQTADIDLTTVLQVDGDVDHVIVELLNNAFPRAAAKLGYVDLILKVHTAKRMPNRKLFEGADFPALKLKIAFARRGTRQEEALKAGKTPGVIDVDISFHEILKQMQVLELTGGAELRAYSLADLMAEKYRAMLQQKKRERNRRQDVYDLDRLITGNQFDKELRKQVFDTFMEKSRSRGIEPSRMSLQDPEIRSRSASDWDTMKLEIGELPAFDDCYRRVAEFYAEMPW
jgi:Nucleotidyl transferase AbiEii toxin, Type IV TA system